MRQHLRHGPVHVAKIASAQNHGSNAGLPHPDRQQRNFQPQIETTLLLIALAEKVRQWRRIAFRAREGSRAKGASASIVTTHGESEVAKLFPRKGPSG